MKKIIFILALFCLAWKDPIGDINARIDKLEALQAQDQEYLQRIQQEFQRVKDIIISRQGGISELKNLLQADNIFKDAEYIPNEEIKNEKGVDIINSDDSGSAYSTGR